MGPPVPAWAIHQDFAELRVFVRPDPGLKKSQLMPKYAGYFVAQTELPCLQLGHKNGLDLVKPQHAVHCKHTSLFGQKHKLGNSIFRTRSMNAGLNCGALVTESARPNTCATKVRRL